MLTTNKIVTATRHRDITSVYALFGRSSTLSFFFILLSHPEAPASRVFSAIMNNEQDVQMVSASNVGTSQQVWPVHSTSTMYFR